MASKGEINLRNCRHLVLRCTIFKHEDILPSFLFDNRALSVWRGCDSPATWASV